MAGPRNLWQIITGALKVLYCWLRIGLYWSGKLCGSTGIRCRRRLLTGQQRKSLVKLGRQVYRLHGEGRAGWSEEAQVQEFLRSLDRSQEKIKELEERLRQMEERYRERVKRLRSAAAGRPAPSET